MICKSAGISENRKIAKTDATTGSRSLDADTNDGDKNFRHQLKILCPKMVEKTLKSKPTTIAETPYPTRGIPDAMVAIRREIPQKRYTI